MKLILFRGRPGSGKTTISDALSKELSFPILRKDDIYDVASKIVTGHDLLNNISYNSLYSILETNKINECTFILDYPFQSLKDLSILKDWCSKNNTNLKSILVTCSDEILWEKRFNTRADSPKPNQLITDFDELKKYYGEMQIESDKNELVVDTINSPENIILNIKYYI